MDDGAPINISSYLSQMADIQPHKRAVVFPAGRDHQGRVAYAHLTFRQLDRESDCLAHGLEQNGISRGTRTVLMVMPSIDFFVLTYALFKTGAVPVVVDPGMGIRRMLRCLEQSQPEAFIGIPKAHLIRRLFPRYFKTIDVAITVGRRWLWGGLTLKDVYQRPWEAFPAAQTTADEIAALLFTTGSTGPAKGVVYTHGVFDAQVRHIRSHFNITAEEIDLPTFPLFALFDPALGMTAVIPDMDPTKPAFVQPEKIIEAAENQGVTNMFASPALLDRVGSYGKAQGIKLPSFKRVISAGAPVYPDNLEQFSYLLSEEAEIHTPYGATEAVPLLSIGSHEILSETRLLSEQGYGLCVGRPLAGLEVRIINISDDAIGTWDDGLCVADGDIGEIVAKGDLVTRQYYRNTRADLLAKIADGEDVWHRMGDLGWRDSKGRMWFCGRKDHRVVSENETLFTIPCEAIFNTHPRVARSALIGVGQRPNQVPVICIELKKDRGGYRKKAIRAELLQLAGEHALTREIDTILFHHRFPVDIRHNAKIFREKLAKWAEKKVKVIA
ncbi:MAG: fatty acid CoA ligase family protein [Desulfobacterales bacterium]